MIDKRLDATCMYVYNSQHYSWYFQEIIGMRCLKEHIHELPFKLSRKTEMFG